MTLPANRRWLDCRRWHSTDTCNAGIEPHVALKIRLLYVAVLLILPACLLTAGGCLALYKLLSAGSVASGLPLIL